MSQKLSSHLQLHSAMQMTAELYSCDSESKHGGEEEKAVAAQDCSMYTGSSVVYALHVCINNHRS